MKKFTFFLNKTIGSRKTYNELVFIAALFFIPFIMIIIRPLNSTDTGGYYSYFTNPASASNVEQSFLLIASLVRVISPELLGFRILLFIYAFLSSVFLFVVLKKSENPFIAFIVYFSFAYIYQMCIQIRSGVANLIFVWAIYDIANKKPKQYYLKMLLAFFFHNSSVLFFVLYPLARFFNKYRRMLVVLPFLFVFLSICLSFLMDQAIFLLSNSKVTMLKTLYAYTYIKQFSEAPVNPFNRISLFLLFVYYFFLFLVKRKNTLEIVSLVIMAFSIFCYFLGKFTLPIISQRYPETFNLILVISLPLLYIRCKEKKIYFLLLLIYLLLINIQYKTLSTMLSYVF